MEDLDRYLARQHGVVRAEHLAHPAGRDAFDHVIAAVERDERATRAVRGRRLRDAPGDDALLPREALEGRSERVRRIVPSGQEATVEAGETPRGGLGAELDRMEAAVDAREANLGALGFWRLVGLIKRDDEAIRRHADQVGSIDGKAFRASSLIRFPVWVGVLLMVAAVATGVAAVVVAVRAGAAEPEPQRAVAGVALLVASFAWAAGLHSLTHFLAGRAVGIRFTALFGSFPPPPLPGLKTDYATYLRASPHARAWMHASGAIATKLAPFLAVAFAPAARAPWWSVAILLAFGVLQLVTDLVFSTRASDWKKVRRERAVGRARRGHTA
jgi:hypothetical protein